MDRFVIKVIFLLVALFALMSCGYLSPKSANEYTVTKQSPLVMPPDMNMVPPSKKSKNKQAIKKQNYQE